MLEAILISRFIVDFFWEYKLLSVFHVLIVSFICLLSFFKIKKRLLWCRTDSLTLCLFLLILHSYTLSFSEESTTIFIKSILFIIFYFVGRLISNDFTSKIYLAKCSFIMILAFFLASKIGIGYKYWGYVNTFTGGYFFKADLALAVIICVAVIFIFYNNKIILFISIACSLWLVIISNSRIAIPLLVILPYLNYSIKRQINKNSILISLIKVIIIAVFFVIIFFTILSTGLLGNNYLSIDFNNLLSNANTQGRSDIWQAIIYGFFRADIFEQLFGLGLDSDIKLTYMFADSIKFAGIGAHNSYLRTIISIGFIGLAVSTMLQISIIKKALKIRVAMNSANQKAFVFYFSLLMIFLVTGLTVDSIIRPQIMLPLSIMSGIMVQISQSTKENEK